MRVDLFMQSLEVIGVGYLGIFVMTSVIIAVVSLLNKFTSGK